MKKILPIMMLICVVASVFALSACTGKTPKAITEAFEDLAEDGKFLSDSGNAGDSAVFDFGKSVTFNTLVLKEKGENITSFRIYADDSDVAFYGNDYIEGLRYCAFETVTASSIRIEVLTADGEWKLKKPEAYLVSGSAEDFEIMAYISVDEAAALEGGKAEVAKKVTDFNLFNVVYFDKDGNLVFNELETDGGKISARGLLKTAVTAIKSLNPSATVVVMVLGNKDFGDGMTVTERHNSAMGSNSDRLKANLIAFVEEYGLDGVSFDYEYPESLKDYTVYKKFVKELKSALPEGKLLTAALAIWNIGVGKLTKKDLANFDSIEIMSYDMFDERGNHAAFYTSAYDVVDRLIGKGLDLKKINLGVPYYSRPVNADPFWGNYYDVADKLSPFENSYTEAYTDINGVSHPELRNYYNGRQMIYDKTAFAMDAGLGGIMIWHFGTDSFDPELSLTNTIAKAIAERS